MNESARYITVEMSISSRIKPINKEWQIKFERDLIMDISIPRFRFSSASMNVAITKVADLVARHPENYFETITIN